MTDSCILAKSAVETAADRVVAAEMLVEESEAAEEWPSPPYCALTMLKTKFCHSLA